MDTAEPNELLGWPDDGPATALPFVPVVGFVSELIGVSLVGSADGASFPVRSFSRCAAALRPRRVNGRLARPIS